MPSAYKKAPQTERHQPERDLGQERASPSSPPARDLGGERASHSSLPAPRPEQPAGSESFADPADRRIVVQPRVSPLPQSTSESDIRYSEGYQSRREQILQQRAEPQTPTINVTIGRIEVKALPPAATTPPPRKPTPSLMSLDEYMRRRNAGGDSR